jgi:hypothetical protein
MGEALLVAVLYRDGQVRSVVDELAREPVVRQRLE